MRIGPRLDGLVRSDDDKTHEFCAIECGRTESGGSTATKVLHDKEKIYKVLQDMLQRLVAVSSHDNRVVSRLQTVGISTVGTTMQVPRLSRGNGYVSLLSLEPACSIPQDVSHLGHFLYLLVMVTRVRDVLNDIITAFRSRWQESTSDDDDAWLNKFRVGGADARNRHSVPTQPPLHSPDF
jgi:hypothetical protein